MRTSTIILMSFALGITSMSAAQQRLLPVPGRPGTFQKDSSVKMMGLENDNLSKAAMQAAPRYEEGKELFEVICTTPASDEWRPVTVTAYQEGYRSFEIDNSGLMTLPTGTYDLVASFDHLSSASYYGSDYRGLVILENVTITGPETINFDPSTSTNRISFNPILPNGEALKFRHVSYDDSWTETVVSEGNFPMSLMTVIYTVGTDGWDSQYGVSTDGTIMDTPYGKTSPEWAMEMYVNEVSDRINFGFTGIFGGDGEENSGTYVISAEQTGSTSAALSNAGSWTETTLTGAWTPRGADTLELIRDNYLNFDPYGLRFLISGGKILNSVTASSFGYTGSQKVYFSNGGNEDAYVKVQIAPVMSEIYKDGFEFKGISNIGGYVWFEGNALEEVTCIPMHMLPYAYTKVKTLDFVMPGCGAFVADQDDNLEENFATAPALFSIIYDDYWAQGDEYYSLFHLDYIGRLGESRYTDKLFAECNATVDGVTVASDVEALSQWLDKNSDRLAGKLEINLIDNNYEVEGKVESNDAIITAYLDNEDFYPPTLTMLQFRDNEGKITSSFYEGEVRLSAADINFSRTEGTFHTDAPAEVTCEYALNGTGEFKELPLTENAEFWSDEILGANYSASLSGAASESGWYDLRITVTDEAGNSQMQTIKMAFEITNNPYTAIESVESMNDDDIALFRIDGVKVSNVALAPGIYIMRKADGSVKKVRIIR